MKEPMDDTMKHFSIEGYGEGLYRITIITAFKDRHEMTVTEETLAVITRILMPKFSPSFRGDRT
jgi:hypothetical protein